MSNIKKRDRILLFDIENSPNIGYVWGKHEQEVIDFQKEWYMLSFAYKWLGEKTVKAYSLPDFKTYKKDKTNDKELLKMLWKLLDEADVVVGHNSNSFDIRKTNARFIVNGMMRPSPYKTVDTLREARKHFFFNSNKLDHLSTLLGIGRKVETGGFKLWLDCMSGDMKAWKRMVKYNKNDILLLEDLYLLLRPWIINHPNRALMDGKERACPTCSSEKVHSKGFAYTRVGKFRRWICTNCGAYSQSRKAEKEFIKPEIK